MTRIDPKYLLIKMIENIEDISKIEQITNCVNYNELFLEKGINKKLYKLAKIEEYINN
jgi:hypothetical protein